MTLNPRLSSVRPVRTPLLVCLLFLLLADVLSVEAGITFEVQVVGAPSSSPNSTNQTGLNITVLGSNTTLLLDSRLKSSAAPGNSTDTSGSDDLNLSWWWWVMIGGGFFILIAVLVVTAVFYSDYAKHLMGYKTLAESGDATSKTGAKVIEVALVHPCRPPPCAMMSVQGYP